MSNNMVVVAESGELRRILCEAFDAATAMRAIVGGESVRRANRSYAACIKLRLVMCTDEGCEETVTDFVTLERDSQHM